MKHNEPKDKGQIDAWENSNFYSHQVGIFSWFMLVSYMIPPFFGKNTTHMGFDLGIRFFGICFCGILLFRNVWSSKSKYDHYYYLFVLFFCLSYSNFLLLLQGPKHPFLMAFFAIYSMLLVIIVDWYTFLFLFCLGGLSGTLTLFIFLPNHINCFDFDDVWNISATIFFIFFVGFFFAKNKEKSLYDRIFLSKLLNSALGHEILDHVNVAHWSAQSIELLLKSVKKSGEKYLDISKIAAIQEQTKHIKAANQSIKKDIQEIKDLMSYQSIKREDLLICSIKKAVLSFYEGLDFRYKKWVVIAEESSDFFTRLPVKFFKNILFNLVKNAIQHGKATRVTIGWDEQTHTLWVKDNGKGIPADIAPHIYDLFYSTRGSGIGLAFVKSIVEFSGGEIYFPLRSGNCTIFTIRWAWVDQNKSLV